MMQGLSFFRLSTFDFPLNAPYQVYEMTPQLAIHALVMSYGDDFAIVPWPLCPSPPKSKFGRTFPFRTSFFYEQNSELQYIMSFIEACPFSTIKYWRNGNVPFVWLKNECPISSANLQSWVKKNTSSCWAEQFHNQPHFSFLVPHLIFIQLLVSRDCKAPNCFAENGGTLFRTNTMIVLALPSWLLFFRPSSNVWMVSTLRYQFFCMQSLHIVYARSKSLPLQR